MTVTSTASVTSKHLSFRVTGVAGFVTSLAGGTGAGAFQPDPPAVNPRAGEADDFLWLTVLGIANSLIGSGDQPANYSNLQTSPGTGQLLHSAERQLNAGSEDPGTWNNDSVSSNWWMVTIAFWPQIGTAPYLRCPGTTILDGSNTALPRNIDLPTLRVAGDLFYGVFINDGNATLTLPAGWTLIKTFVDASNELRLSAYVYEVLGTECSTMSVSTSTAETLAARIFCINGHADPSNLLPTASTGVEGDSTAPDPDAVSVTDGDYLVIPLIGINNGLRTITASPTGYSFSQAVTDDGGTGDVRFATALNQKNGTSFNPGAATLNASSLWTAFTVAIPSASLESSSTPARRRLIFGKRDRAPQPFDPLTWFLRTGARAEARP